MPVQGMNPLNPAPPAARPAASGPPADAARGAPGAFARLLGGASPSMVANPQSGRRAIEAGADDPQPEDIGPQPPSGSADGVGAPHAPEGLEGLWAMLGLAAADPSAPDMQAMQSMPATVTADAPAAAATSDPEATVTTAMSGASPAAGGLAADAIPGAQAGLSAARNDVPDPASRASSTAADQNARARAAAAAQALSARPHEPPLLPVASARFPAASALQGDPAAVALDSLSQPVPATSAMGPARVQAESVPGALHPARALVGSAALADGLADAGMARAQPATASAISDEVLDTLLPQDGRAATPAVAAGLERSSHAAELFSAAAPASMSPAMERGATPLLTPGVIDLRLPQASQQLAESVVWQLDQAAQEVRIRLNPQELGSVDVQLRLDGDKVSVRFDMADASVRDMVQTSLPQLSSMLAARGLALDQAQVFSQDRGQSQSQGGAVPSETSERRSSSETSADPAQVWRRSTHSGVFDHYA